MKININIDPNCAETEITINCAAMGEELEKVIASLRALDFKLTGTRNGQTYILDARKVLYIETVDKKTFLYTAAEVYETNLRLYELEEMLAARDFFRAGKSSIINFAKIKSLKSDIDGRIVVMLENNEKMIVSSQRLVLARAVLHRPKILFLDEPTSALDPVTARGIHKLIRSLRDSGSTIFLTTHNMEEAANLCDRVVLLHRGRIIEQGTPGDICERYNAVKTALDLESVFVQLTGEGLQ